MNRLLSSTAVFLDVPLPDSDLIRRVEMRVWAEDTKHYPWYFYQGYDLMMREAAEP